MREYEKGERCGIDNCRSRQYYVEDGQWCCSNGHVRLGRLEVEDIEFDGVSQSQKISTTKSNASETTDGEETDDQEWTGKDGYELFLQAYQLVLRHQLHWLITSRGMPGELHLLVRDLWGLKLKLLSSKVDVGYASSADDSQVSDSQVSQLSDSTLSTASQVRRQQRKKRRTTKFETPKLIETLCLCYLGMMILRVPVPLRDLYDWMESLKLPYLNATGVMPENMKKKLHAKYKRIFQPRSLPTILDLYQHTHLIFREYQKEHGIDIAPLNYIPLLFRFLQELGLPPELYNPAKKLAGLLSYDFSFPPPEQHNVYKPQHPDVGLVSLLVVAARLWYGFDDIKRSPYSKEDLSATFPNWQSWERHLKSLNESEKTPRPKNWEINLEEKEIFDMNDVDLDLYMDWYERTWYSGEGKGDRGRAPRRILNFFDEEAEPMHIMLPADISEQFSRLCKLHTTDLEHVRPVREGKDEAYVIRSGDRYISYNPDRSFELPPKLELFLKAAASCVGLPLKVFMKELWHMENGCLTKEKELRKEKTEASKSKGKQADDGLDPGATESGGLSGFDNSSSVGGNPAQKGGEAGELESGISMALELDADAGVELEPAVDTHMELVVEDDTASRTDE